MDEELSLVSVFAHGLLNEMTVVGGLLAQAREHLDPNTPDNQRAADLLEASELKTGDVVAKLRGYVRGAGADEPPHHVIDLDEPASHETRPGPPS